jgi:hypothetical protein
MGDSFCTHNNNTTNYTLYINVDKIIRCGGHNLDQINSFRLSGSSYIILFFKTNKTKISDYVWNLGRTKKCGYI